MDNVERLHQAGIIPHPELLDPEEKNKVNGLSSDEIATLIAVDQKMGWSKTGRHRDFCEGSVENTNGF